MVSERGLRATEFVIGERVFDAETGIARFHYRLDDAPFVEEFCFPKSSARPLTAADSEVRDGLLGLLHVLAGVSYYKAGIPDRVYVPADTLTEEGLALAEAAYTKGLGEFAFENQVEVTPRFQVEALRPSVNVSKREPTLGDPVLVAIGGGKDSCVALESMRAMGVPVTLASVGNPLPIQRVVEVANLPHLVLRRTLDPSLQSLNERGAFNGHVPVTSIVSTALVVAAFLHGLEVVVMANERSANVGNVEYLGAMVNHQWSKSHEAERLLQAAYTSTGAAVATQTTHAAEAAEASGAVEALGVVEVNGAAGAVEGPRATPTYFSVLRAFSELEIARRFAQLKAYHPVFTSCNRAFILDESRRAAGWCGDCPKCRFVFLALAPWMHPADLEAVFGQDLLDNPQQIGGYSALMGFGNYKPFECVGEVEESQAALLMLERQSEWRDHAVVRWFAQEILPNVVNRDQLVAAPFVASAEHSIPAVFQGVLQ